METIQPSQSGKGPRLASPIKRPPKQAAPPAPPAQDKQPEFKIPKGWCLYNVAAFRRRRLETNMGERLVSRAAGTSADAVRKIYAGRNDLNLTTIWRVAQALGLPWEEVFGEGDKDGLFKIPPKDSTFKIGG